MLQSSSALRMILKVTFAFAMRPYAGFSRKREPVFCGRGAGFLAGVSSTGWYVRVRPGAGGRRRFCMRARIDRHKDGSIKAKGHIKDGELDGYWEWFRKDGSKMRSGYFADGKQVGEWTTCDTKGKVVKVTKFSR